MKNEIEETPFVLIERRVNLKSTCLYILEAILEFTSTHKKKTPSIFDSKSNLNMDSEQNIIDEYDFDDLFQFCVKKLKLDDNLLILMMMNIDKIISNENFIWNF